MQVLENLESILFKTDCQWKFVIVNDGSHDDFKKLQLDKSFYQIATLEKNSGKGAAIKAGIAFCSNSNFVVTFDADLDIDPNCLPNMIAAVVNEDCSIAIASKLHPSSRVDYTRIRKTLSYGYFIFVKMLFGLEVRDTQTGAKVFHSEALACLRDNQQEGFVFDLESLVRAKHLGFRIQQFPVTIKMTENSTVGAKDIFQMAIATLRLRIRHRES